MHQLIDFKTTIKGTALTPHKSSSTSETPLSRTFYGLFIFIVHNLLVIAQQSMGRPLMGDDECPSYLYLMRASQKTNYFFFIVHKMLNSEKPAHPVALFYYYYV